MAFWSKPNYTYDDLRKIQRALTDADLKKVEILVIDDEKFAYLESMSSRGFHIRPLPDLHDFKAVEPYDVVLCDIKGVGKSFGSEYEGAFVISEIKRRYPHKVVVAYSNQSWDFRYAEKIKGADFRVDKNETPDRWQEILESAQRKVIDPIRKWKDMAKYLIESDVEMAELTKIEEAYMTACIEAKPEQIKEASGKARVSPEIKEALVSLAASVIFRLIKESA
jgi:hypothetical protein